MFKNRVKTLLKKPQPAQRTPEWYSARHTRVTASEVASCLFLNDYTCDSYIKSFPHSNLKKNPEKGASHFDTIDDYLVKKCRAFYGENVFVDTVPTLWGKKYEEVATRLYRKEFNTQVYEFGLLNHPRLKWLGASPDGITPEGTMLEIKCPWKRKIIENVPPFHYWIQMQIQLEVCNLDKCDFLECEIFQFNTIEEFEESTDINKGILVNKTEHDNSSETKYIYPPDNLNTQEEMINWANVQRGKIEEPTELVFYSITKWHVINIERNKEWFENVKNDIKQVHLKIIKFQNDRELFDNFRESIFKLTHKIFLEKYENTQCLIGDESTTEQELEEMLCVINSTDDFVFEE